MHQPSSRTSCLTRACPSAEVSAARPRTVGCVDPADVSRRKRRSNRAVVGGLSLLATAVLLSLSDILPRILTTAGAVAGFALIMYGVHVGWTVFYDREPEGPAT